VMPRAITMLRTSVQSEVRMKPAPSNAPPKANFLTEGVIVFWAASELEFITAGLAQGLLSLPQKKQ
jgi:hypothetical protein